MYPVKNDESISAFAWERFSALSTSNHSFYDDPALRCMKLPTPQPPDILPFHSDRQPSSRTCAPCITRAGRGPRLSGSWTQIPYVTRFSDMSNRTHRSTRTGRLLEAFLPQYRARMARAIHNASIYTLISPKCSQSSYLGVDMPHATLATRYAGDSLLCKRK